MLEIISVILSAVGIGLLMYSLFSFILSSTVQKSIEENSLPRKNADSSKNDKSLRNSLIVLAGSLVLLLFSRFLLSLSELTAFSEWFYYILFGHLTGMVFISVIVFRAVKKDLPKMVAAFSVVFVALIVFLSVSVFI